MAYLSHLDIGSMLDLFTNDEMKQRVWALLSLSWKKYKL